MKQLFEVSGKIIDMSQPYQMPGKDYILMFITIEIVNDNPKFDNEKLGYYTFSYWIFDKRKVPGISIGDFVDCTLRRSSNIWKTNNTWNIKKEYKYINGEKLEIGNHPIILDSYTAVGLITKTYKPAKKRKKKQREHKFEMPEEEQHENLINVDTLPEDYDDDLPF